MRLVLVWGAERADRFRVDDGLTARMIRDAAALITAVDETVTGVLGWRPDELVGRPSTDFIHPEDQASAVAAWFSMLAAPGQARVWRGRYQAADGTWRWVESVNHNQLDDPDDPVVVSTMTLVTVDQVGTEEELRARKQLLSRLSDALPVGLFQIDMDRRITFTNDRFHTIVGCPPAATLDAQFATLDPGDGGQLDGAVTAALAEDMVDDVELRLRPSSADGGSGAGGRVVVLAMRALTDSGGTVTGAIGCLSDVTDRVQLRIELERRASIDDLTSCLNRAATLELLADVLARVETAEGGTAVVYIDLDRFKAVNDGLGHAAGDHLLEIAARRLRAAVRDGDQLGRVGGDEFLVVCPAVDTPATALVIATRVADALTATIRIDRHRVKLRASVGVAWTAERVDPDTLVARADSAMYASKSAGLHTATLYAPRGTTVPDRGTSPPA